MQQFQPWIVWMIAATCFLIIEMLTPGLFYFLCFGIAAAFAGIAAFLGASYWIPWIVFCVSSLLLVLVLRPLAVRLTKAGGRPSNVDGLIGEEGSVTEAIDPDKGTGKIRIGSETWRAQSQQKIDIGSRVKVIRAEGVHLIVERKGD